MAEPGRSGAAAHPIARVLVVLGLLLVAACGGGGPAPDSNNWYVVGGGHGKDFTPIGAFKGPNTDGACDYYPSVNVRKTAKKVVIQTKVQCIVMGSVPQICGSQLNAQQNSFGGDYEVVDPRNTCNTAAGIEGRSVTRSCVNPSTCTGRWTAEAGVYIEAPVGATWTPRHNRCQTNGAVINCFDIEYAGSTVT